MRSFQLGDVDISNVVEWQGEIAPVSTIIPSAPETLWQNNRSWLTPEHWNPDTDHYHAAVQTWVLRSEGKTILIDTGVGNARHRPHNPLFDNLDTDFLANLAAAGVQPEDVDIVVNTHIHADHVGWNTRGGDNGWEPTFPRARYIIPRADKEFFDPVNARSAARDERDERRQRGNCLLYTDSIEPVLDRADLWERGYRVDGNLTLEPAPGHTPGSSVVRLTSGTDRAVFVGDLLHSPVQILEPEHNSCFCEDAVIARRTRREVLERAADARELVIPAHFAGSGLAEIGRDGDRFQITNWLP